MLQSPKGFAGPGRHDLPGRLVLRAARPAEDGPRPLPARRNALHGQRAHAAARTARRSGPTTWARTCWPSSWASGSIPLDEAVKGDFAKVTAPVVPAGKVAAKAPFGYVLDGRLNDSVPGGQPAVGQGRRACGAWTRRPTACAPATGSCRPAPGRRRRRRRTADGRGLQPAEGAP
ncbi:MAG: hypothetical protein MZW92_40485 [Comamonadaceae bacterium]|nr:hypothetical protein [Comamonadaceae bacterium]